MIPILIKWLCWIVVLIPLSTANFVDVITFTDIKHTTVSTGSTVNLWCRLETFSTPSVLSNVVWTKRNETILQIVNGNVLNNNSSKYNVNLENGIGVYDMSVTSVTESDAGTYDCYILSPSHSKVRNYLTVIGMSLGHAPIPIENNVIVPNDGHQNGVPINIMPCTCTNDGKRFLPVKFFLWAMVSSLFLLTWWY